PRPVSPVPAADRPRLPCRPRLARGRTGGIVNIQLCIGDECHRGLCNKERCPRVWLNCLIRHYAADPRMPQRRSNIQTLSCSCPAPRSCSTARRRRPPSISSCRKEILTSPSGRWIRHLVTSASPSHRRLDRTVTPFWVAPTSRPSACSSYSYCRGPLALTNVALYRKVGSRCSIRTTPLCTAAAPGLRVLACRF